MEKVHISVEVTAAEATAAIKNMSNYDIQAEAARKIFLKYNQEEIVEEFKLVHDENYIFVNFVHSLYRIEKNCGRVERKEAENWVPGNFHEAMSIYDMLCNKNGFPVLAGKWSPIGNLGGMRNASAPVGAEAFAQYGEAFAGKQELLRRACEMLGGSAAPKGDVAYYLPMFDFFPVYLRFYDADEEFSAQLQILWDTNTCRYVHYETTFYMTDVLLETLYKFMQQDLGV